MFGRATPWLALTVRFHIAESRLSLKMFRTGNIESFLDLKNDPDVIIIQFILLNRKLFMGIKT